MKHVLSLVLVVFASQEAQCFSLESYSAGYGILNSGMFAESIDADGNTSLLGSFSFHFLTGTLQWRDGQNTYRLRGGYTILPRESEDGAVDVTQWLLSGHVGRPLGASGLWTWNSGMGVLVTKSKGNGGSIQLNNGSGTSTFFRPSDTSESSILNFETGVSYKISPTWDLSIDLILNGIFSRKRNGFLFVSFNYTWSASGGSVSYDRPPPTTRGRY